MKRLLNWQPPLWALVPLFLALWALFAVTTRFGVGDSAMLAAGGIAALRTHGSRYMNI